MSTSYPAPMSATYRYRTRNFDGTFNLFTIPCLVLGETAASYIISTMRELCGLPKGHRMTVRKHNVTIKPADSPRNDCTEAWWHK